MTQTAEAQTAASTATRTVAQTATRTVAQTAEAQTVARADSASDSDKGSGESGSDSDSYSDTDSDIGDSDTGSIRLRIMQLFRIEKEYYWGIRWLIQNRHASVHVQDQYGYGPIDWCISCLAPAPPASFLLRPPSRPAMMHPLAGGGEPPAEERAQVTRFGAVGRKKGVRDG